MCFGVNLVAIIDELPLCFGVRERRLLKDPRLLEHPARCLQEELRGIQRRPESLHHRDIELLTRLHQRAINIAHHTPHLGWNLGEQLDRKSTRLNSSHVRISYAVFCLKKKKMTN